MSRPRTVQIPARWVVPADVDTNWQMHSVCRGVIVNHLIEDDRAIFPFPKDDDEISGAFVSAMCVRCPVRENCLEFALKLGYTGVWGGQNLTEADLRRYRDAMEVDLLQVAG